MPLLIHTHMNTSHILVAASASRYKPLLDHINAGHVQGEIARYLAVSGVALLLYDWLTTLDKEIEYTWGRKWTLARVVYHLNRVLPVLLIGGVLIPNVLFAPAYFTPSRCRKVSLSYSYGVIVLLVIICTTSIIRCWALYGQRWVLWLLIPGLIVTAGHGMLQVTINIKKATIMANPCVLPLRFSVCIHANQRYPPVPELLRGCLISIPNSIWLAYFSGVLYELLVFCLIVWRVWQLGGGLSLTPLLKQLLTNGASYFAVNLGLMLFSCIGAAYPSTIIMANASGLLTALSSIMCSRIFFSMYEFAREDRVRISPGPPGARGDASMSCQFAIPMETFSNDSSAPSALQLTFAIPEQSLGQPVSKDKDMTRSSNILPV
ncbi:hypothetical protein B0J17DRAFT_770529 [Rhizoctonia solani]|nr:hypothetical protein B0J17DRAFT_770529 [Rhizoctonia solani]